MLYKTREEKVAKLTELVKKFEDNFEQYKSKEYKEAKLRVDFLNPFFEILDWDIRNESGKSEVYRDVIVEDTLEVDGSKKAPDFCFKIGKERKFYAEAKKPSVDIKNDVEPSLQVRRYGYTAGLPLSILTDFEEFAVYDTSIKPKKNDKASDARIRILTYKDYVKEFDYLYDTFSKTAIEQGSFDKYAQSSKNKRGTEAIDKGLLSLVEETRLLLAKNISKLNKIDKDDLNFSVVKIIDRIMFLRIAEDKKVEPYATLLNAANSSLPYKNLKNVFSKANERYNSGLFQESKLIDNLYIDDKVLKDIIKSFYFPECPYEFSVLPISVLGNIYEQFLGQTIHQTPSGMVKIEEKPEVRKAGGVYYTPEYIVEYIVKNTVGEKIKDLTPKEIEKIKILDPACGSGSFLIGAYQCLLDYHLEYYTKDDKELKKTLKTGSIIEVSKDKYSYRLSIPEKQKILKNNIFGVDIDAQAVEVSKFSLLIKLMETETSESMDELFTISHVESKKGMKILPNLSDNIKCGNSLIGKDFIGNNLFADNEEIKKVHPFDWNEEFTEIIKSGGFDCVIGNPPYGADLDNNEKIYLDNKFKVGNTDTACLFLFHSKLISKDHAFNGFIIPKSFTYASNWKKSRDLLLNDMQIIVDCSKVWKDVKLEMSIYVCKKNIKSLKFQSYIRISEKIEKIGEISKKMCNQFDFIINGISEDEIKIGLKLKNENSSMKNICYIERGQDIQEFLTNEKIYKKVYRCKSVQRYHLRETFEGVSENNYIKLKKKLDYMNNQKILIQNIVAHIMNPKPHISLMATFDEKGVISLGSVGNIYVKDNKDNPLFLLAILNSKIISWYAYKFIYANAIRTMRFDNVHLEKLPFPKAALEEKNKVLASVNDMLLIQKQLHSTKIDKDKEIYQQKADIIDKQIDKLVYDLYGLTDEEIKIVERKV